MSIHTIQQNIKKKFLENSFILSWEEEENQFLGFTVKLLQDELSSSQAKWLGEQLIEISGEIEKKEKKLFN